MVSDNVQEWITNGPNTFTLLKCKFRILAQIPLFLISSLCWLRCSLHLYRNLSIYGTNFAINRRLSISISFGRITIFRYKVTPMLWSLSAFSDSKRHHTTHYTQIYRYCTVQSLCKAYYSNKWSLKYRSLSAFSVTDAVGNLLLRSDVFATN